MFLKDTSNNTEMELDELDTVSGGAGSGYPEEKKGVIVQKISDNSFKVQLHNGTYIQCALSWKMQSDKRLGVGSQVRVQISPYSIHEAQIVGRF
jgi:translation initiation factor IF-1